MRKLHLPNRWKCRKNAGDGAAQGGARYVLAGAGREPGGDAAGGGGEEQAEQVAQLHARALFRIQMATTGDLKCQNRQLQLCVLSVRCDRGIAGMPCPVTLDSEVLPPEPVQGPGAP